MEGFSQELKKARVSLGHKTARSFFDWLKERGASFNYSYYMRLEQGGIPSEKVVQELAQILKGEWTDRLILAYCRSLFPKNAYLFPAKEEKTTIKNETYIPSGQKELSIKQVAVIAAQEAHYHIFLLTTLARQPIAVKDLQRWFSVKTISSSIQRLVEAKLVREVPEGLSAFSVEAKFPEPYNKELQEAYEKFDLWDRQFGERFALDFMVNKMLIRRVSGRYLSIIRQQLEGVFEIMRSSDELDTRYNDNVLQLNVVLRQGKLPG